MVAISRRAPAAARKSAKRRPAGWRNAFRCLGWTAASIWLLHLLIVLSLRWIDVPTTAFMLRSIVQGHALRYEWVDRKDIAPAMAIAVVASEDQRFPFHHGFDIDAIVDAVEASTRNTRLRGASTISQQTAKNLFLWPGRSWVRKGLEAYCTVLIEALWPKRRILEVYLNIAEFGPGVYGVGAASRRFFRLQPRGLTLYHASLLTAVLPNPRQRQVLRPSPYVLRRAAEIRRQVALLGGTQYLAEVK